MDRSTRASLWVAVAAGLASGLIGCDGGQPTEPPAQPTFALSAPSAPSNTAAAAVALDTIRVSWKDNSTNENGFQVYRSTNGSGGTYSLRATQPANTTTLRDPNLAPLTSYCYKIRAFRTRDGQTSYSGFSTPACATTPPPPVPVAPSATVATPASSSIVAVSWADGSSTETGFRVQRSLDAGSTWTVVGTVGSNVTAFQDGERTAELQVCYRVVAFNAGGNSSPSSIACTTPPAAPSGLRAQTAQQGIDLAWTDNSSVEDGYQVQRSGDGVNFLVLADLPGSGATYHDVTATNATYWYRVVAQKDGGFSDLSNVSSAAGPLPTVPTTPSLQQPEGYYLGTMWLFWWNPGNVDSYKVERCDQENCAEADFTLIATIAAGVSSMAYQDWGLADWTIYTYRIRATNRVGDSEPSNPAQGRTCIEEVDWYSPCFPPLP